MINTQRNIKKFQKETGRNLNPHPTFTEKINDRGDVSISHVTMPAMSLEAYDALQRQNEKKRRSKKRSR
jgi:hypothetical protein